MPNLKLEELLKLREELEKKNSEVAKLSKEYLLKIEELASETLDTEDLEKFKSVIQASRDLSDGTYTGTAPVANERF